MTLDLESLRLVIAVLDYDEQAIAGARHIVELAIAELAARRACDAEVEALVAALREAMEWNWLDEDASPSKVADQCEKALAPFAGDKT